MIEAPLETSGVAVAYPIKDAVGLFPNTVLEPVRGQDGNKRERKNQGAEKSEGHSVSHRVEKFSGGTSEGVNGEVPGDDDGDGIKNGAVNVAGGSEDDFV